MVERHALAIDTSDEVERRQIEHWRTMSPAQKAAIVSGLTQAAYALTFAGVRQRYPNADEREQFLRVALITGCPRRPRHCPRPGERLDREYLQRNAPILGVADLLERALGQL
jgi:hypothetical protein